MDGGVVRSFLQGLKPRPPKEALWHGLATEAASYNRYSSGMFFRAWVTESLASAPLRPWSVMES